MTSARAAAEHGLGKAEWGGERKQGFQICLISWAEIVSLGFQLTEQYLSREIGLKAKNKCFAVFVCHPRWRVCFSPLGRAPLLTSPSHACSVSDRSSGLNRLKIFLSTPTPGPERTFLVLVINLFIHLFMIWLGKNYLAYSVAMYKFSK